MKLHKRLQSPRTYSDLLILLAGVIIGYTVTLPTFFKKLSYLFFAIAFILLAGYIKKKEKQEE